MKLLLVNLVLATSFAAAAAQVETCTLSDGSKQSVITPRAAAVQSVASALATHETAEQKDQAIYQILASEAADLCTLAAPAYTMGSTPVSFSDCVKIMGSEGMREVIADSKQTAMTSSLSCQLGLEVKYELTYGAGMDNSFLGMDLE